MYNADANLSSDVCWKNAKDTNNNNIEKYALYFNDTARENKPYGSLPTFVLDHVNLRGRPGYGLSDDYLVDNYSTLRNNPDAMTRDRCPIQLHTRVFVGGPKLKGCKQTKDTDIQNELDILSGSDTRNMGYKCNKSIMEENLNNMIPLLDCIKEVQNPNNIIPSWTRGGEDTRSYLHKIKYSKCSPV